VNISFNIFTAFTIDVFVSLETAEFDDACKVYDLRVSTIKDAMKSHNHLLLHAEMPTHVKYIQTVALDIDGLEDAKHDHTERVVNRVRRNSMVPNSSFS